MEQTFPLQVSMTAKVPASGNVMVTLAPSTPRQWWEVTAVAVKASSNVSEPTARVYNGNRGALFMSTYTGSGDSGSCYQVVNGGGIFCDWTGADVGATVELFLYGTVHVGQ
jgi:hypothetical protein